MKQRIITGLIGVVFVILLLIFRTNIIFNIAIMLVALVAVNEALCATKMVKNLGVYLLSSLYAAIAPYYCFFDISPTRVSITAVYAFALMMILITQHEKVSIKEITYAGAMTVFISNSLAALTYVSNTGIGIDGHKFDGLMMLLIALGSAWISDTGAYFVGSKFGKNKLCPKVSPKKTVEGLVGGIVTNVLFCLILGIVFNSFVFEGYKANLGWMLLVGFIGTLVSTVGDLVFSCIKRECGLKDYGNIMPGHGGILDRIDSLLVVSPFVSMFTLYIPLIVY